MTSLLLGVDSGGSKTTVVLADERGHILGEGRSGCSNYQYVGEASAVAKIDAAIDAAFAQANLPRRVTDYACFGIGGVDTAEDMVKAQRWVSDNHWAKRCLTVNDGMLPLYAVCADGVGVSVIAGTGAIMWAQTSDGRVARSSGWGYLLGDEGGGWELGYQVLRHLARSVDGRGPATQLKDAVLAHWQLANVYGLITRLYQSDVQPSDIASLARVALDCAAAGDEIALQIAQRGADELALGAWAVAHELHLQTPFTLAYSGSLLIKGLHYRKLFAAACHQRIGDVTLIPVEDPVTGAVAAAHLLMTADVEHAA